ncbi:MAG: winged helix-turn-helix transcriptional regulator [Bacteroidetes bacterium]|nr:winged helix-turn-helix transcriptional regulator [Bacteroidota bacterium]
MVEDTVSSQIVRLHKLKGKIFNLLGITWTQYLILCSLADLSDRSPRITTMGLIDHLQMNRAWVYGNLRVLSEIGAVDLGPRNPRFARIVRLTYEGRRLISRMNFLLDVKNPEQPQLPGENITANV